MLCKLGKSGFGGDGGKLKVREMGVEVFDGVRGGRLGLLRG